MGRSRPSTPHTVGTSISHRGLRTRLTPRPRLGSCGRGSRGRPGHVAARKHIGCRLRLGDSGSRGSRARASEPSGSGFESRFGHFEPTVDKCMFATQTSCRRALGGRARSGEEASAGAPSKASGFFRGPSVWTEDGARGQGPSSGSREMTHLRHCLRLRSEKSHFNIHPSEKNKTQQNTLFQVLHDSKTVIRSLPGLLFFRTNNPIPAILPSLTFNHL